MLNTRGRPVSAHDRAIDVRMRQLRKKLSINTPGKALFTTIRGGGYMLNCEVITLQSE
jgi:DNA-binding response OmpR family regulator